jgi:hypothetical protein
MLNEKEEQLMYDVLDDFIEKKSVVSYVDEDGVRRDHEYDGDIRREIEECFSLVFEEALGRELTEEEHSEVTEDALNTF